MSHTKREPLFVEWQYRATIRYGRLQRICWLLAATAKRRRVKPNSLQPRNKQPNFIVPLLAQLGTYAYYRNFLLFVYGCNYFCIVLFNALCETFANVFIVGANQPRCRAHVGFVHRLSMVMTSQSASPTSTSRRDLLAGDCSLGVSATVAVVVVGRSARCRLGKRQVLSGLSSD